MPDEPIIYLNGDYVHLLEGQLAFASGDEARATAVLEACRPGREATVYFRVAWASLATSFTTRRPRMRSRLWWTKPSKKSSMVKLR